MLSQLRQDHANMARILHVLQLKYKTLDKGERPNFQLMREVVDYILSYMEGFTQPIERLCVDYLQTTVPEHAELGKQMAEDYRALQRRLKRLSNDIDMILMDAIVPMDRFAADLKSYVETHRRYLRQEREELFPLIQEHLNEEEMQQLKKTLPEGTEQELERLQEAYPEIYAELREAQVPTF